MRRLLYLACVLAACKDPAPVTGDAHQADAPQVAIDAPADAAPDTPPPPVGPWFIQAFNGDPNDSFGGSVSMSADGLVLAVGAENEASSSIGIDGDPTKNDDLNAGAVYVYARANATDPWVKTAYIKASNTNGYRRFGASVALSADGHTLAVGSPEEASSATGIDGDQHDNGAPGSGAVYVFAPYGASSWRQQAYIKASHVDMAAFGNSVALSADGNVLAVGAPYDRSCATGVDGDQTNTGCVESGAAYAFSRSGTTWTQQAYIKPSDTTAYDHFAYALAIAGDGYTIAAGSMGRGIGYVFVPSGGVWAQQAALLPTNTGGGMGRSAALSNDGSTAVFGAPYEGAMNNGAAYVFDRVNVTGVWGSATRIEGSNMDPSDELGFSAAVAPDGSRIAIGANCESSNATGIGGNQQDNSATCAGAVYAFDRGSSSWTQRAYVKATNTAAYDQFGRSVSLGSAVLAVGASGQSGFRGAAYVYDAL